MPRGRVPQGQVELVLPKGRKALPKVSPLQEQQAWLPVVLSGRPVPLREPEAPVQPLSHWVPLVHRVWQLQEARWLAVAPEPEPLASSAPLWLPRPWLPFRLWRRPPLELLPPRDPEYSCEPFRRHPPESNLSASSFP